MFRLPARLQALSVRRVHAIHTRLHGSIRLIMGPMYSGKSTRLLELAAEAERAERKVVVIKFHNDTRYDSDENTLITHNLVSHAAVSANLLCEAATLPTVSTAEVVCVDEGQFYADAAEQCDLWAQEGKTVIVAALDGTFQRSPFRAVSALIARADAVEKVLAVCDGCGSPAPFSKRISAETEEVVIGGADKYQATCRTCYH